MNLSELKIGQIAKVLELNESSYREKLLEMGCIPGALIKATLKAPFGDPLAFELEGYTLSMRKSEAQSVKVQLTMQFD